MAEATIKTLYSDREKNEILYPRTKVGAISDNDGIGLEAILDHMVYSSDVEAGGAQPGEYIDASALGGRGPEYYASKNELKEETDAIENNLVNNYLDKTSIEGMYASKSCVDDKVADIISGGKLILKLLIPY